MTRRQWLTAAASSPLIAQSSPGFRLADVTASAGLAFRHNNGAYGSKFLPETLGPGCAFLDYDADGWLDILLVNGADWPGHRRAKSTLALYRNNRNGTFTDVTRAAGLDVEMYGMGVAVGDYDNDGFPDLFISCVGQSRLFRNNRRGGFTDVTPKSGLQGRESFSTSALWFDYNRDGLLDLFVCNYVQWSAARDVFCTLDRRNKSYCTPEAYRGATCWLFRNRGDGTFEDVTAPSGIFDSTSKSLGVAMLDANGDGWPDLYVANDTRPNKLYINQRNGTFQEQALAFNVAFSEDGKSRAGMGVDAVYLNNSSQPSIAVTNFDNEMAGFYQPASAGRYEDRAARSGIALPTRTTLGFGCLFADIDLDGSPDLIVANGHIDDTVRNIRRDVQHAQPPHLFLNDGHNLFRDVAAHAGGGFATPRIGRGLAWGDFDRDGDVDLLFTTNGGAPVLYRNDLANGNRSIRFHLQGRTSNRDAIGALVRLEDRGITQTAMVRSGSSYLSHSSLALTFGVARRDRIARVIVHWPNGRIDEHKNLAVGRAYHCIEGGPIKPLDAY